MDGIQQMLRNKLNQDKIKLWLPPYTNENGEKGEIPEDLVEKYAADLKVNKEIVSSALEQLRLHALEKLAARDKYQQSGIATVKVKISGQLPENLEFKQGINLEISLKETGKVFKDKLAAQTGLENVRLKIICSGKVIDDDASLENQYVKNNSILMALYLSQTESEARRKEDELAQVRKTREAAEILSARKDHKGAAHEEYFFKITDQSGKHLELPPNESEALTLAMTLNEKGRAALKRKQHGIALLLFLEADKEFRKCKADILNAVDNYAILCLDIVWCYLCLKNINDLPDAEAKLQTCEELFHRSYGPNLERLRSLRRGATGNEMALYLRLHILQGILAYHKGQREHAAQLLQRAELELRSLQVDDSALSQVISLGFSEQEARLGLRACGNNVQQAIENIMQKKDEKLKNEKEEKEKRRLRKLTNSLGKTAYGEWVLAGHYENLISMGFPKGAVAEALRQTNNNVEASVQLIQTQPELLNLPDPPPPKNTKIDEDMIAQVVNMGFPEDIARQAMKWASGNVNSAITELLRTNGVWMHSDSDSSSSCSSASVTPTSSSGEEVKKSEEQKQKEKDAEDEIASDLPEYDEEYLDLTLRDEADFLAEYKALVNSMGMS